MTAVIGLEQSRSPVDLVRVVDALRGRLRDPRDGELRRAFTEWMQRLTRRLVPAMKEEPSPVQTTLEALRMTLEERVAQWPKQWFQEGLEQGIEHERALLCRMASSRFGSATVEPLSVLLARITDPDRLADVGDWLVHCGTGEEFLAHVGPLAHDQDRGEV